MTIPEIVLGLIGLGIMVFVHELGHFVAAKMNGVAVEVFSLGWGPRLIGLRRGGTMYQISWFPIGGYCKMRGEITPGMVGGSGQRDAASGGPAQLPAKRFPEQTERAPGGSFNEAPSWRRIVISAFGPLFNLIFAALVFTVIWWAGFDTATYDNRIVLATDYTLGSFPQTPPATLAGLKTGDRITAIDGRPVENFQDILEGVSTQPNRRLVLTIQRAEGGSTRTLEIPITPRLDRDSGAGQIGIYAWVDPVVASVASGSAAAFAGLRPGDRIVRADDRPVRNAIDLSQVLASKPQQVQLGVERGGRLMNVTVVPTYDEKGGVDLGIAYARTIYRSPRVGVLGGVERGLAETWNTAALTVKGIALLFRGVNIRNAVAGPIRITEMIGSVALGGFQQGVGAGFVYLFRFLAFLSVVLFLMNLLPIPAMDGGQIIIFLAEIIRGKAVKPAFFWRIQIIGFTILLALFFVVSSNDILHLLGR